MFLCAITFRVLVDEDNGGYSLTSLNGADDQFMLSHLPVTTYTTQLCRIILNLLIYLSDMFSICISTLVG